MILFFSNTNFVKYLFESKWGVKFKEFKICFHQTDLPINKKLY